MVTLLLVGPDLGSKIKKYRAGKERGREKERERGREREY